MILSKLENFIEYVLVQNSLNFVFKIWEIVEEIKADIDRLFSDWNIKKRSILGKSIRNYLQYQSKSSLSASDFTFSIISQILKTKFYVFFGRKHVETEPSFSHERTIYLLLEKVASLCEQFGPVSTCLCPKYINICFHNLGNGKEDKNGRR